MAKFDWVPTTPGKGYPPIRLHRVMPQRIQCHARFSSLPVKHSLRFVTITTSNSNRGGQVHSRGISSICGKRCIILIIRFRSGIEHRQPTDYGRAGSGISRFSTTWSLESGGSLNVEDIHLLNVSMEDFEILFQLTEDRGPWVP